MINPYDILGVTAGATPEEIETRYRFLLREYHPDLHQAEGPEAVGYAEQMTQRINDAMNSIRSGKARPPEPRTEATDSRAWQRDDESFFGYKIGDPDRDWFGKRTDGGTDDPVPCPFCGNPFESLADYEAHLVAAHGFRMPDASPVKQRWSPLDKVGMLRFVPTWLALLVGLGLWLAFGFVWFLGALTFIALILWAQTTPRFRDRNIWTS